MTDRRLRASLGSAVRLGAATLLATTLLVGTASMLFGRDYGAPRVVVLGAGDTLSALVTAGAARVLIATGDDPIAFGNALARVQPWTARRIDVVLAAGDGRTLSVPASLAGAPHVRTMLTIGVPPASPEAAVLTHLPPISAARRLRLPDGVSIMVEPIAVTGANGEDASTWRAVVEHGATRVLIAGDGLAIGAVPTSGPFAAVVVAGADPLVAFGAVDAGALVVAADAASGAELVDTSTLVDDPPTRAWRVHPGETVALALVDGGVALPPDGMVALATPTAPDATGAASD